MSIHRGLCLLAGAGLVLAHPVFAGPGGLPARYGADATPVAIYRTPDPDAEVVATIADAPAIVEVIDLSEDGDWARIGGGETSGWVATGALTRLTSPRDQGLPLRCYGTEPFWGVVLPTPYLAEFERPEHPEVPFQITGTADRSGPTGRTRLWTLTGEGATASLLVRHESCSDGMSDRAFGLSAAFTLIAATGQVDLRLGCCSLTTP